MSSTEKEFFEGKRIWSRLKDQVLQRYLPPYLKKVNTLKKQIVLVDSFAGPGYFKENNEEGSPLIICKLAEKYVPNNYLTILVNTRKSHHNELNKALSAFIQSQKAFPIHGTADLLLEKLSNIITDQTLFIYLDPFGLKGTDFNTLQKFLSRTKRHSTELLINLSIPTIIRYSCLNVIKSKGITPDIQKKHNIVSKALGGDYWKDIILDNNIPHSTRQERIIREYVRRLKQFLPYVGFCRVFEKDERSKLKYVIIHASRHPHAQLLMNDIMYDTYSQYIWERYSKNTLFEELNWEDVIPDEYFKGLETDIISLVTKKGLIKRKDLWQLFTLHRFMQYHSKHFKSKVSELVKRNVLGFNDTRKTGKLNDESELYTIRK